MHLSVTISWPTLIALALTGFAFAWATAATNDQPSGSFIPNFSGIFYFGVALVATLGIWLARACCALWFGI